MHAPVRVAIFGAASEPAYLLGFRLAAGGMFGPEQTVSLALCDAPETVPVLEATTMELADCAFPLLAGLQFGHDAEAAFANADWIILVGGRAYEPNLGRMDLLRANAPLLVAAGRAANDAAPRARVLVAIHPSNTGCAIGARYAPNLPREHWFGLIRNARMRATVLIARKAGVPIDRVQRVTVWGNHSENIYVDVHNALIDGRPAMSVLRDENWARRVLPGEIIGRSFRVRSLRGGLPSGTIAQAILGTVRSITTPTAHSRWFGAAVSSDGSYSVPRGLFFAFPLTTADGRRWAIQQGIYLDRHAQERLAANVAELEHEAAVAGGFL